MDRIRLHYSKFCALARNTEFRAWLRTNAADQEEFLAQANTAVGGCKQRAERMATVYNKIYEAGKGDEFEKLIRSRFPYVVDHNADPLRPDANPKKHLRINKPSSQPIPRTSDVSKSMDPHGVFKLYRPEILTFPQKRILINDNPAQLQAQVAHFTQDKFGVETLIIGERAYIEYFEPRYKDVANRIPPEKRDIFQYKQRMKNAANSPSS